MPTPAFEGIMRFIREAGTDLPLFVIAGGGEWSLQYAKALQWFIATDQVAVLIFYKSNYEVGDTHYLRYLQNTINNMVEAEQWGARCFDESTLSQEEMNRLPAILKPHAIFVVTPAEVHCENAAFWAPYARYVFIEKPLATSVQQVKDLRKQLGQHEAHVFGYDHYAARLRPSLEEPSLTALGWGSTSSKFKFEMFEAAPRGLVARGPSVKKIGMIFDMASHAVPLLKWISASLDSVAEAQTTLVASTLLNPVTQRGYISSETFAKLQFSFLAPSTFGGGRIDATVQIGKGIGVADSKFVELRGAKGKLKLDQLFMLATNDYNESAVPIHERVIYTLVTDVLKERPAKNAGVFPLEDGEQIVNVLSYWTSELRNLWANKNRLAAYHQGMTAEAICSNEDHRTIFSWPKSPE